jgi:3-dehydroquinate dehydratase
MMPSREDQALINTGAFGHNRAAVQVAIVQCFSPSP